MGNGLRRIGVLIALLVSLSVVVQPALAQDAAVSTCSLDAKITFHIIYAPESATYLPKIIDAFNTSYVEKKNPLDDSDLKPSDPIICVTGESRSSGTAAGQMLVAVSNSNPAEVASATIFQPSVKNWLELVNYWTDSDVFDFSSDQARDTALAPVVLAIWEDRLEAIRAKVGPNVGWEDILAVAQSPNGWTDYGILGRKQLYYGHTDPFVSSTGLSTLISEYYVAAKLTGKQFTGAIPLSVVNDPEVQDKVREIQKLVIHYSNRTTEFKNYIAQGPEFIDFVALEENDLLDINRGRTKFTPPQRLIGLCPKEGTFIHGHPMGIVNAFWVSADQKMAAKIFVDYVLLPAQQQIISEEGFRPATQSVPLSGVFSPDNGIDASCGQTLFQEPKVDVIAQMQNTWGPLQKPADVMIVFDTSGSMGDDNRLFNAQNAVLSLLAGMQPNNRVGLISFSTTVNNTIAPDFVPTAVPNLIETIQNLQAEGDTALFNAIEEAITALADLPNSDGRIRIIIVLTDGANTEAGSKVNLLNHIRAIRDSASPIIVIPLLYAASDAKAQIDMQDIARAAGTQLIRALQDDINNLLVQIGSLSGTNREQSAPASTP